MKNMFLAAATILMIGNPTGTSAGEQTSDARNISGWEAVGRLNIADRNMCTGALIAPDLVLTAPDAGPRATIAPGVRDISVVDVASTNTVLGPLSITIADGGLYTIMLHESGDGTTVSALLLDDFQ